MIPTPENQLKLVLVGDSSVGKSSILIRFVDDNFNESLLSTIGVDFKFRRITIDKKQIKLQIWDTAGQETFRSIVSAYYNSADAIVIVYDITSYKSFESVKQYWVEEAENQNKNDALIFMIGNKIDQEEKRQVLKDSVEDLLKEHQFSQSFQVSAKNGTGIEECFTKIVKMLMKKTGPVGQKEKNIKIIPENATGQNENFKENKSKFSDCCK